MRSKQRRTLWPTILSLSFIISAICLIEKPSGHLISEKNIEVLSDGEDYGGGTCCEQEIAICIYGEHVFPGYYFIPAGPCKNSRD